MIVALEKLNSQRTSLSLELKYMFSVEDMLMFTERCAYLEHLMTKCSKKFEQGKLLRLIEMSSTRLEAKQAMEFISQLDKLLDICFHPAGEITVNGFQDGLCRYKCFRRI